MKKHILIAIGVLAISILVVILFKDETLQILGKGSVMGSIAFILLKVFKIKRLDEK